MNSKRVPRTAFSITMWSVSAPVARALSYDAAEGGHRIDGGGVAHRCPGDFCVHLHDLGCRLVTERGVLRAGREAAGRHVERVRSADPTSPARIVGAACTKPCPVMAATTASAARPDSFCCLCVYG